MDVMLHPRKPVAGDVVVDVVAVAVVLDEEDEAEAKAAVVKEAAAILMDLKYIME
jgi:hypothetical protein